MFEYQIENDINRELLFEDRQFALDFVSFLQKFHLQFEKDNGYWRDKIYYIVKKDSKCVCFISIKNPDEPDNRWTIWSDDMNSEWLANYPLEQEDREIAWRHVDTCGNCGSCGGGRPKNIFGKEFPSVCGCTFRVNNPDENDLEFLKKMVEIRVEEISGAKSTIAR